MNKKYLRLLKANKSELSQGLKEIEVRVDIHMKVTNLLFYGTGVAALKYMNY